MSIRFKDPQIQLALGAGGKASRRLVEGLTAPLNNLIEVWISLTR